MGWTHPSSLFDRSFSSDEERVGNTNITDISDKDCNDRKDPVTDLPTKSRPLYL